MQLLEAALTKPTATNLKCVVLRTGGVIRSTDMSSHPQGTTNRYTLTFLGKEAKAGFLADCCLVFCPINITLVHLTAEVLSEEPILKWYKDAHLAKGKSVFLEQMKKFVEWLKNAEEESESEAEEGD